MSLAETDELNAELDAAYQAKHGRRCPTIVRAHPEHGQRRSDSPHIRKERSWTKRTLGEGLEVSATGLGCIGMSQYGRSRRARRWSR